MYCLCAPVDVHYYLMFRYGSLIHVLKLLSFPMCVALLPLMVVGDRGMLSILNEVGRGDAPFLIL